MTPLWHHRCSACEKPWIVIAGNEVCATPGCKYRANLPESKTGLSSPGKPMRDPALAREARDLERQVGYTPALPFTECNCAQLADEPHFLGCPLYEEPDIKIWTLDWELVDLVMPTVSCPLCAMSVAGEHEKTCPAKPGHSCKFCGRPIVGNLGGWIHDSTNDWEKCGKAPSPKAYMVTGVCMHGNPRAGGCQACDADPFETKLCIHGKPIGVAFGTCWECNA